MRLGEHSRFPPTPTATSLREGGKFSFCVWCTFSSRFCVCETCDAWEFCEEGKNACMTVKRMKRNKRWQLFGKNACKHSRSCTHIHSLMMLKIQHLRAGRWGGPFQDKMHTWSWRDKVNKPKKPTKRSGLGNELCFSFIFYSHFSVRNIVWFFVGIGVSNECGQKRTLKLLKAVVFLFRTPFFVIPTVLLVSSFFLQSLFMHATTEMSENVQRFSLVYSDSVAVPVRSGCSRM